MLTIWYHLWVFRAICTHGRCWAEAESHRGHPAALCDWLTEVTAWRALREKVGMTPTQPWHCTASDVARDLWAHSAQPLLQQGRPQQGAQAHIQAASEDFHEGVFTTSVGTSRKLCHQAYPPTRKGEKTCWFRTPKNQFDIWRVALWYSLPHSLFDGVFLILMAVEHL